MGIYASRSHVHAHVHVIVLCRHILACAAAWLREYIMQGSCMYSAGSACANHVHVHIHVDTMYCIFIITHVHVCTHAHVHVFGVYDDHTINSFHF